VSSLRQFSIIVDVADLSHRYTSLVQQQRSCELPSIAPIMASACTFVGNLGLEHGCSVTLGDTKRNYWKHDAFVAVAEGDYPAQIFIYAGLESKPVDRGTYFVMVRAVLAPSTKADCDDAELLLYTNNVHASSVVGSISSTVYPAT